MELKDFIRETLISIIDGIKESQDIAIEKNALVSPNDYQVRGKGIVGIDGALVEEVNFDIGIEAEEKRTSGGGLSISVMKASGNNVNEKRNINRITFSIPVVYPRMKSDKFNGL